MCVWARCKRIAPDFNNEEMICAFESLVTPSDRKHFWKHAPRPDGTYKTDFQDRKMEERYGTDTYSNEAYGLQICEFI